MPPHAKRPKNPTPKELREIFPENLRQLTSKSRSIAALAREIGINRTQLNRYLSGGSFPTPDVLHRICRHFGVDARILLEPLKSDTTARATTEALGEAFGELMSVAGARSAKENEIKSGFYRVVQHTPIEAGRVVVQLGRIWRNADKVARFKAFVDREVFIGIGLPFIRPVPHVEGLCFGVTEGVAVISALTGTKQIGFTHLMPDAFGREGVFHGTLKLAGRGDGAWFPRRKVIFRRLPAYRKALEQRRMFTGFRPISELPDEERSIFESI